MAESDLHVEEMIYLRNSVGVWFENQPDVYVSSNTFLYYEQGNPRAVVSPDLYVVFGVEKRLRDSYQVWKEGGRLPSLVLEVTSKSTQQMDVPTERSQATNKYEVYEKVLRVPEYFLFDPTGDYLEPPLRGYRLVAGEYVRIAPESQPLPRLPVERQPRYRLHSVELGLDLTYDGQRLRLYDPESGKPLLRANEAIHKAEVEAQARAVSDLRADDAIHKAEVEAQARAEAEVRAEKAMHKAEAERKRSEAERKRAEVEAQARMQADLRVHQEIQARTQAEADLARLRAELEALRGVA